MLVAYRRKRGDREDISLKRRMTEITRVFFFFFFFFLDMLLEASQWDGPLPASVGVSRKSWDYLKLIGQFNVLDATIKKTEDLKVS